MLSKLLLLCIFFLFFKYLVLFLVIASHCILLQSPSFHWLYWCSLDTTICFSFVQEIVSLAIALFFFSFSINKNFDQNVCLYLSVFSFHWTTYHTLYLFYSWFWLSSSHPQFWLQFMQTNTVYFIFSFSLKTGFLSLWASSS